MSVYRRSESKIFWMDFHFVGQWIRESTKMPSRTRAREVEAKRKQELRDRAAGIRKREAPKLFPSRQPNGWRRKRRSGRHVCSTSRRIQ